VSGIRSAIADAISSVPGLSGTPLQPVTITAGIGWPVWVRSEYATKLGRCQSVATTWEIRVCLPPLAAPDAADHIRDQVAEAIAAAGLLVESAEPDAYQMADTDVPIVRYTATSRP
jgi:hypothetical protein